jgi:hypothetical protein
MVTFKGGEYEYLGGANKYSQKDQEGNYISDGGYYRKDENGNYVSASGKVYTKNADGNYTDSDGFVYDENMNVLGRNTKGNWYVFKGDVLDRKIGEDKYQGTGGGVYTKTAEGLYKRGDGVYFDENFNKHNIDRFYQLYPGAIGKKICVYAPSFSGNAARPVTVGFTDELLDMFSRHSDEWFFITKLHPNMEKHYPEFISDIHTEELFAPSDLLITDYSSIVFDYMLYNKPFILYAPDISAYNKERGFYIDISTLPAPVVKNVSDLEKLLLSDGWKRDPEDIRKCASIYMKKCDGHAVDRIIQVMGIEE